jgi:nucleoside-diphosphate-sugar epimerase
MKAFVTGGTGLLGNNLVRLLVEQGYSVKALVRSPEKGSQIFSDLNITLVQGDMLDIDSFAEELAGCDILFHTAAYFREYYQPGNHWQMLEDINVNAVERGKNGDRYITAGQYYTLENLFQTLERISGIPGPKLRIPYNLTVILAWFSDNYARLTRTKSVIPLEGIRIMHEKIQLDSAKAIKELEVTFRPLEETLRDVVDWYQKTEVIS